ncbi:MAG: tRNA (guanosine(46)-N7)-methyltransferase TrmB [Planctomycetota bacterium]|nr:MAG: tRNA (guanosine(46)-N7)-methyltransferase TrmB [Planctomycetota bacterium]
MGRRALRRIDPALDLSRHLVALEAVSQPLDPEAMFARLAPLEIEVGSGKGLFLAAAASADPDADFLGIEILGKYARYVAARLANRELPNARIIHGDAQHLFASWLKDASVQAVHVYFPDPWWKARHKKRRVMNEAFVGNVERVLVPGGRLHFWTDVEEYFHTALETIGGNTALTGPHPVEEKPADHDLDYRTHFERRMRLAGEAVYRAEFEKPRPARPGG